MDQEETKSCIRIFLNGEMERGNGGAVLYNADTKKAAYLLRHEFTPPNFVETLDEIMEENPHNLFIVIEENKQLHINKIPMNEAVKLVYDEKMVNVESD